MKKIITIGGLALLASLTLSLPVFAKTSKDGFDSATNQKVEVGNWELELPAYYSYDESAETWKVVNANGNVDVGMVAGASQSQIDVKLIKRNEDVASSQLTDEFKEWIKEYSLDLELDGTFAFLTKGTSSGNDVEILMICDDEKSEVTSFVIVEDKNSEFDYFGDIMASISTLKKKTEDATSETDASGVSADFKKKMDEIVAFYKKYNEFMVEYSKADSSKMLDMASDYLALVQELNKMQEALNGIDVSSLSEADQAYYYDCMIEIDKYILDAANTMK